MKIRTQEDIAELEKVPVTERIRHRNVFDLLRGAADLHAGRIAIRYLSGRSAVTLLGVYLGLDPARVEVHAREAALTPAAGPVDGVPRVDAGDDLLTIAEFEEAGAAGIAGADGGAPRGARDSSLRSHDLTFKALAPM